MSINYSANDFKVLFILYRNGCSNQMKAFTINKIKENTNLSIGKIMKILKVFLSDGYIKEGVTHHNEKSYYVSKKRYRKN